MKKFPKANLDERPIMIITGIFALYFLIEIFIIYLFLLHRINLITTGISTFIFTLIYLPRFFIIKRLQKNDNVQIIDDYLMINNTGIPISEIENFKVETRKPKVIFFISNKMIIFQQAIFYLKLPAETISFTVTGSEKIELLTKFLQESITA